jgi:hypothetical protein
LVGVKLSEGVWDDLAHGRDGSAAVGRIRWAGGPVSATMEPFVKPGMGADHEGTDTEDDDS